MSRAPHPADNQTGAPERPFPVTRDGLERALRETLSRQVVVAQPIAADPAGTAIRRAKRAQRRRALTGLALAVVATALVTTGMAQLNGDSRGSTTPTVVLGDPPGPPVSPSPTRPATSASAPVGAEVDLIVGNSLGTTDGDRLDLTGVGPVDRAQRAPDTGVWLVVGAPTAAGRTLWSVSRGAAAQVLLAGADAIALSPDGRRVAWRDGTDLFAAGIVGPRLIASVRTTAPAGAAPVRFVGDAVLVRLDPGAPGYALWRPSAGALPAGADRSILNVYGVLLDGRVVGQVSAGTPRRPCLALLDPARSLAPESTGCGPTFSTDGHGTVSTDGRWLLVNGSPGGRDAATRNALLVDLAAFAPSLAARSAGPALTDVVAWAPERTAVYVDGGGALVRLPVDRVLAGGRASSTLVTGDGSGDRPVVVTGGPS